MCAYSKDTVERFRGLWGIVQQTHYGGRVGSFIIEEIFGEVQSKSK